jgi:hypothetical protein
MVLLVRIACYPPDTDVSRFIPPASNSALGLVREPGKTAEQARFSVRIFEVPIMLARAARDYNEATKEALRQDAVHLAADEPANASTLNASPLTAAEKAQRLRDLGPAAYLYGASAPLLGEAIDVETWKLYLDGFLQELGSPADPVARLMIQQLALAHFALGRLHVRASTRILPEEVAAYSAAIGRLMAEFRRTTLALNAYRAVTPRREADGTPAQPKPSSGKRGSGRKKKGRSKVSSKNRIKEYLGAREPVLS